MVIIYVKTVGDNDKEFVENEILEQRPIAGTKVIAGDVITFVLPNLVVNYPNFVEEKWSLDAISSFCDEYGIVLEVVSEENDSYAAGTVIRQDRVAGTRVRNGYPLKITVASKKEAKTDDKTDDKTTSKSDDKLEP